MMLAKRRLYRMQLAGSGKPFDRNNLRALCRHRQHRAGFDRVAVDMHDAATALACIATHVCACQAKILSEQIDE